MDCGEYQLQKDCDKPLKTVWAAARNMEYYARKPGYEGSTVHQVLAEICQQLDASEGAASGDSGKPSSNRLLFDSLLARTRSGRMDRDGSTDNGLAKEVESESYGDEAMQVLIINHTWTLQAGNDFLGACIDSAAQESYWKGTCGVQRLRPLDSRLTRTKGWTP